MKYSAFATALFLGILFTNSCFKDAVIDDPDPDVVTEVNPQTYNADWTELTHGNVTQIMLLLFPNPPSTKLKLPWEPTSGQPFATT